MRMLAWGETILTKLINGWQVAADAAAVIAAADDPIRIYTMLI
jgi:hypothetical protein